MDKHRHQEWIKFLKQIDPQTPAELDLHLIADNYSHAHYNLSHAWLLRGDFQPGWEESEWRWKCADFPSPLRNLVQPLWDGRPLEGRRILLHAEQGLGDTIQFIRCLPLVAQQGGEAIVECQSELQRLFRTSARGCQIVPRVDVADGGVHVVELAALIGEAADAKGPAADGATLQIQV